MFLQVKNRFCKAIIFALASVAFSFAIRAAGAHHEQDGLGVMIAQAGTATKQTEQVLSSRSAIREAQSLLSQLGYEPGPVDGLWGPKTASAYRSFLIDRNLPVASGLTASNLSQMRRASSGQPATQTTAQPTLSIYAAAAIGRMDQVDAALHSGVNVDSVDGRGWTALMYAADNNNTDVASLLIGAGANANLMAPDGSTALSLAEQRGHGETIALLSSSTAAARTNAERSTFRSAPAESRMTKPSATSDAATQFLLGLLSILD